MRQHKPKNGLVLTPSEWREVLSGELITNGFEQDAARLIARRVIERLVRDYLSGGLDRKGIATHTLDEAA